MKAKSVILTVIGFVLVFLAGCGAPGSKSTGQGKPVFPPEVAGIWQAADEPWVIEISPEGKVIMAVIPMTETEVKPNEMSMLEMADGNVSTVEMGDCPLEYDPLKRELTVTITVKAIHMRFYEQGVDGNSTDIFSGRVSEDGKRWQADWMTFFDYGPRFPQNKDDPGDVFMGPILFYKVKRAAPADSNNKQGMNQLEEMLHPSIPADPNSNRR